MVIDMDNNEKRKNDYPLISIVVPIYNIEDYLPECVESILAQTYKNIEVILVNDGSEDGCPAICDSYERTDSRVHVLHKPNGGLVSARKAGARLAQGMYILPIDGDDWVDPDYVQNMSHHLCESCPDMVVNLSLYKSYADGRNHERGTHFETRFYKDDEIVSDLYPHFANDDSFWETDLPMSVVSYLYRRDFYLMLQEKVSDEIAMGEDNCLTFLAFMETDSVQVINKPGYHYRQREGSICHVVGKSYFKDAELIYKSLCQAINKINDICKVQAMRRKIPRVIFHLLLLGATERVVNISSDFFFPYPMVKNNARVFVYGMGALGERILHSLMISDRFCLIGCSDQGWRKFGGKIYLSGFECKVYAPDDILGLEFDYLIIAVSRAKLRSDIEAELVALGVSKDRIARIDEDLLIEENLPF